MTTTVPLHQHMHLTRPPEIVRPFYEYFEGKSTVSTVRTTKWAELREWYERNQDARPVEVRAIIDKE